MTLKVKDKNDLLLGYILGVFDKDSSFIEIASWLLQYNLVENCTKVIRDELCFSDSLH